MPLEKGNLWGAVNYCNYFQSSKQKGMIETVPIYMTFEFLYLESSRKSRKQSALPISQPGSFSKDIFKSQLFECLCLTIKESKEKQEG